MTPEPTTGTVAVRSSLSAWRVIVVGATGLLAVGMGSVVGSFLILSGGAGPGAAAAYVPADAVAYFELRLDLSSQEEADLAALVERFPGGKISGTVLDKVGELIDAGFESEGIDLRWAEDVAPWFDGHIGVALLDYPSPLDPASAGAPTAVAFAGNTDAAAATAATDRMRAAAEATGATASSTEHDGTTVWSLEHTSGEAIAYAITADQVVVGTEADAVTAALDVAAGRQPSLADRPELVSLTGQLPAEWIAFFASDTASMWAQMRADLGALGPQTDAVLDTLAEATPTLFAGAVVASGDRVTVHVASDLPTGDFSPTTADRGLATHVPGDALYYAEGSNLGPALATFVSAVKEAARSAPDVPTDELDQVEAALGADLEQLVSWIGDGGLAIGWDEEEPYAGLVLAATDASEAQRRLDQLASFARLAALDPGSGISVSVETVAGSEVTTIHFGVPLDPTGPLPTAVPTDLAVQYAFADDLALIGLGERFVERSLQLDVAASLAAAERFEAAVAGLGGPSNAGMTYLDLAGIREAIEAAIPAEAGMLGYGEVRPYLEPFDYFAQVSLIEGQALVSRSALVFR